MKFFTEEENGTAAGTFEADIQIDTSISAPTEIHALINGSPSAADQEAVITWYPNGVNVEVTSSSGDPKADVQVNGNTVSVSVTDSSFDNQTVTVKLTPK